MRNLLLVCGLASACGASHTIAVAPGRPSISMASVWLQGVPTEISFQWPNVEICNFDDWFCDTPEGITTTVLSVTCHGCTVLEDPTGTTTWSSTPRSLKAVATSDDAIVVEIALRFDATGDEQTISASAFGDHEIALEATCALIDVTELHVGATSPGSQLVEGFGLRPCGADRRATEAVLVFPAIRTARDRRYFPYCFPGWACPDDSGAPLRPLDQLIIHPAPAGWGQLTYRPDRELVYFAAFSAETTGSIELHTRLLLGSDASASLEIPALP